jgi:hypothetical protein
MTNNIYLEKVCLNGTKGSKKGENRYKTMNREDVLQFHKQKNLCRKERTLNGEVYKEASTSR